jgi:hypothetical protein
MNILKDNKYQDAIFKEYVTFMAAGWEKLIGI